MLKNCKMYSFIFWYDLVSFTLWNPKQMSSHCKELCMNKLNNSFCTKCTIDPSLITKLFKKMDIKVNTVKHYKKQQLNTK